MKNNFTNYRPINLKDIGKKFKGTEKTVATHIPGIYDHLTKRGLTVAKEKGITPANVIFGRTEVVQGLSKSLNTDVVTIEKGLDLLAEGNTPLINFLTDGDNTNNQSVSFTNYTWQKDID